MEKYLVVLEKTNTGYSAYSPEVLGCIAAGENFEETLSLMRSALEAHLQLMAESGEELPKPTGTQAYLDARQMSEGSQYFMTHLSITLPPVETAPF